MHEQSMRTAAEQLVERSRVAMVGVNGSDGYPWIKAMFKLESEGLLTCWFSTNTSSERVQRLLCDARASLYFSDQSTIEGLMMVGEMQVITDDLEIKRRFWWEGCEKYYPQGVTDPDYSVLRFTARWGRYYHHLQIASFELTSQTAEARQE